MGFLKSLVLAWKSSYIVSEWAWVWQSCWCHVSKSWCHQQSFLFWFLCLLSVHLQSLVIIIEMGDVLSCNNIQKHEEWAVYRHDYQHDESKGVRMKIIYSYFWIEYYSEWFISDRQIRYWNRVMKTRSYRQLCQKL